MAATPASSFDSLYCSEDNWVADDVHEEEEDDEGRLVLSMLQWRMNPVTPRSFVDYFARRLGLKGHLCREFVRRSELILLDIIPDPRFLCYQPLAMAAAVMICTMDTFDPHTNAQYQDKLTGILPEIGTMGNRSLTAGIVDACCNLVPELAAESWMLGHCYTNKRKF